MSDNAGNTATINNSLSYNVDTHAPTVNLTLDELNDGDTLNADDLTSDITLGGNLGDALTDGDTVTVTVTVGDTTHTLPVNVDSEGNFSVTLPDDLIDSTDGSGSIDVTVSVTDSAGNVATITDTVDYTVDTSGPTSSTSSVTLNPIGTDGVINANESTQNLTVSGTVSGEFNANDAVTVSVGDNTYSANVDDNGNFSVTVPGSVLADNHQVNVTATVSDDAGNTAPISVSQAIPSIPQVQRATPPVSPLTLLVLTASLMRTKRRKTR
ncbi:Ig-like domain-containing protein [Veronia nyctiphanis]|uniref:Ig-like domain-containing protein n=1 Tax=Veronia nyctiphanis TaxID=1278244 RepID=UPI001375DEA3|nr:Ig-like domain-containing protein [Veronia nyctiphanis]